MDGSRIRIARVVAVVVLLGTAAAATTRAGETEGAVAAPRLRAPVQFHRTLATSPLGARGRQHLRRATWAGGTYTTQSGERVTVYVSSAYADADSDGRRWASFVASLVHGSELSLARIYVAPPSEVQELCESDHVLGCYGSNTVVSIGEPVGAVAPEEVVRHEYGHHVAANRQNAPWAAIDWGTKRWATRAGVCGRVAGGTAFPGDEGLHYSLNPGEAFAEAFRVLNEVRGGATGFRWTLADASFAPDAAALDAVEQDVLKPWAAQSPRTVAGRFAGRSRSWSTPLATPLDGDLEVTLRMPLGAGHTLELVEAGGGVVARGLWSGSGTRTIRHRVCGRRSFTVRVRNAGGPRRFVLRASVP
jgi:hypothetical protein